MGSWRLGASIPSGPVSARPFPCRWSTISSLSMSVASALGITQVCRAYDFVRAVLVSSDTRIAALCLASITPLAAGYMLNGGYSWRLYFYVCLALALAIFILAFCFVEQTSYNRTAAIAAESALSELPAPTEKGPTADQSETVVQANSNSELVPERRTYLQTHLLVGFVVLVFLFFLFLV